MASTVWAAAATRMHDETHILRLLKDAGSTARVVEVRLLNEDPQSFWPPQTRRWVSSNDLAKIATEIAKFIADSGAADVRIFVSDEA
jgi:hypothetical protein